MISTMTILHTSLSLVLVYHQFHRAVHTDHRTHPAILIAFYVLTAVALYALFAPIIVTGWEPSWETIGLLFGITIVQGVTARFWRHGTPDSFHHHHSVG
jgi:hypothetical protein